MTIRRFITALLGAIVIPSIIASCSPSDDLSGETYGIITTGYTALRIDPMVFAGIVTELNQGDGVRIVARSREKSWVGKKRDYWYRVSTRDGLTGWVFGQNITLRASEREGSIDSMVSDFMKVEEARIKTNIAGKWWSTNEFGDFTDHCIELYDSAKYKSYMKGGEERPIVGTYRINFDRNELVFSNGSSFKSNLNLARRGNDYILKKNLKDYELRFTKISIETSPEPEIKEPDRGKIKAGGDGNPPQ